MENGGNICMRLASLKCFLHVQGVEPGMKDVRISKGEIDLRLSKMKMKANYLIQLITSLCIGHVHLEKIYFTCVIWIKHLHQ